MKIEELNLNCIKAVRIYNKSRNVADLSKALSLNSQLGFMKRANIKDTNNFKDKKLLQMWGLN